MRFQKVTPENYFDTDIRRYIELKTREEKLQFIYDVFVNNWRIFRIAPPLAQYLDKSSQVLDRALTRDMKIRCLERKTVAQREKLRRYVNSIGTFLLRLFWGHRGWGTLFSILYYAKEMILSRSKLLYYRDLPSLVSRSRLKRSA
jgi:hypothetical protein